MGGLIIPGARFLGGLSRTVAGFGGGGSAWSIGCLRLVSGFGAGLRIISREERVIGPGGFEVGDEVPKWGGLVEVPD